MRASRSRLFGSLGIAAVLAVGAAACSDDSDSASSPTTTAMSSGSEMGSGTTMAGGDGDMAALREANIGPACSAVPASGPGSFSGMAQDPAATAASGNPELSTLVSAVQAANLVATLNGPGPFTIFAPANSAFDKVPTETLDAVLADPSGQLTQILTYHVVAGDYDAAELVDMGEAETVQGGTVEVALDGGSVTINGESAVVCGNVQVGNGTVHIIDTVLMPTM